MPNELNKNKSELIKRIVCTVLVVIFLPILLTNIVLIIQGLVNPNTPPNIFGYMPLAVLSGSMDDGSKDCIKVNDMIFVKKADPQTFKEGDIITFKHNGDITTHRIKEVVKEGDKIVSFQTKGDANNATDGLIAVEKVYGIYQGRIGGLGGFVIFLQTPMGMLVFAGIPISVFVVLEIMSFINMKKKKASDEELDAKDAEIERLKALIEQSSDKENASVSEKEGEPQSDIDEQEYPTNQPDKND